MKKLNRKSLLVYFIPLMLFIIIAIFLWRGLSVNPTTIPSVLIDKPMPIFDLPTLKNPEHRFTYRQLLNHVTLLNVWASWCGYCREEHPVLMDIAEKHIVQIVSLDYKDNRFQALNLLKEYGNPYKAIGFDKNGYVAMNFGVYGTPETFIIDKQGIIRYEHIGPLTQKVWRNKLLPIIKKLKKS